MANSQVFAPTRRVKSQTDVSRRFHADRATVVLPPFELSTGELPPVRQSRARLPFGRCKSNRFKILHGLAWDSSTSDTSTQTRYGADTGRPSYSDSRTTAFGPNPNAKAQWTGPLRWLAFQASPSVQSAIPNRARSLMRNCPGSAERAGG